LNNLQNSDARLFCKNKQTNLKNMPRISNLTENNKPRKIQKHKTSRQVTYKSREENSKKAQNVQIYTKTRPNFVLQLIETAKVT